LNPHLAKSGSARTLLESLWLHRSLTYQLAKREVVGRYRGSMAGLAWSFFNPLLMLAVYTFVFSVIFQARWTGLEGRKGGFAIVLFVGVLVHGIFAECLNRAPTLIMANTNYVKRVMFPLEILPWVAMGSSLFHAFISLIVLVIAQLLLIGNIPPSAVVLPLIFVPLVLTTMGISYIFAAFGVYLRDIGQITVVITTVALFLSPVFYPATALPENYRVIFFLNPLTFIIEQARDAMIWGRWPHWGGLAIYTGASLVICWIGFWTFQKMRRGFADVL
jgi:ABC-type polysaccharide/polyol phosphate export systems, permease component